MNDDPRDAVVQAAREVLSVWTLGGGRDIVMDKLAAALAALPAPPSTAPDAIVPKWAGRRVP